jgi:hypothetical protein
VTWSVQIWLGQEVRLFLAMIQAGTSWVRFPMGSLGFSIYLILPVCTMALRSTQILTGMCARNINGNKKRPVRRALTVRRDVFYGDIQEVIKKQRFRIRESLRRRRKGKSRI